MYMKTVRFALCLSLLLSSEVYADSINDYGPLKTYAQAPLLTNGLAPQIRSGFAMPLDTVELYGTATAASIWARTEYYTLDYYQNQIAIGGKWQFTDTWQLEIGYRWNFAANNYLDGLTIAFHDWFNIDQNGRTEVHKDRFVIDMPIYGIEERNFKGSTLSQGIYSYLQYQMYQTEHHAISVGATLHYSGIGSGIFYGSDWEQAVQINYGYMRGKHGFDALMSITFRDSDTNFEFLPYTDQNWSFGASYRYEWFENHFLVAEAMFFQRVSEGDDQFSEMAYEVTLGYRYQLENSAIEFSANENIINYDNSTDIAFTLSWRYRFSG